MADLSDRERSESTSSRAQAVARGRLASEFLGMSGTKKKILTGFVLLAVIGAGLMLPSLIDRWRQPANSAQVQVEQQPPGAQAFLDTGRTGDQRTQTSDRAETPWTAKLGGWMARLGLSFAGGLIVGIFFRAFVKTMAMITALAVAAIAALGYFGIIDVDSVRSGADSAAGWATARGQEVNDVVLRVLPPAGTGVVGFFFGLFKK